MSALPLLALLSAASPAHDGAFVDFAREVRPILSRNCLVCHGPDEGSREADLRFDSFEAATRDRGGYRAIVPGDSAESEAFLRITDESDPMPPADSGHALTADEIAVLGRWINQGAAYAPHWAFVPPARPSLPAVRDAAWPRNAIDAFILARIESEGLAPALEAERWTLARRASLDITGLPPSYDEALAFVRDEGSDAYERYVDRLLASPAYGERWASVWLDLARYADSTGHGSDPLRTIWRYRDWVIDALNANMPFDQFTVEQLAGDLLPEPTLNQRLATAFHRNTMTNTEGGTDDEEFRVAAVKDRAITTAQVWLGLTLGCAQCHSHKYDPLSHAEFYSFFAFFNQTADTDKPDDRPRIETPRDADLAAVEELNERIAGLEAELEDPARDVSVQLAAWVASERAAEDGWRVLDVTALHSTGGAELAQLDDGSILATGTSPETDVTRIEATSALAEITAVRLEVLPHESLAQGGPGRVPGIGNVVLNDLRLKAAPATGGPPTGRFLRVTNLGEGVILSLAEFEVLSGGENVALGGTATQSSTAYGGEAPRAIDGNTDGHYSEGNSVTHTGTEDDPWLEVDLGREVSLETVRLWNRTDGGLERRLAGFVIEAFDAERRSVWTAGIRQPPRPDLELDLTDGFGEVLLTAASADFSDPEWGVGLAIDVDTSAMTGWGLNPSLGGDHVAVFETASAPAGTHLAFTLTQAYGGHHTLGRFRISVTDRPRPVRALARDVAHALALPAAERTDADERALERHYQTIDPELAAIRTKIAELDAELTGFAVPTTPVMVELAADMQRETHILLRGNFLAPGQAVGPDVPAALHDWPASAPRDRLGLARWIVRPENPLTARVAANRMWARLFGRGIVTTEENFGTQGHPPSHPALLDWLAREYVESGWDTKALLKTMLTSATYMQASDVSPEALTRDPAGELYARGPRFRMDAEMVRDVLLATSGLLSPRTHGPSVFPPQPEGMWQAAFNGQRTWTESTGEDRYRRALYVFLRRTIPYPSLATFDATSRETCTLRRTRTNTPLQAFVTLNDPAYVEAAQAFARRIVRGGGASARERAEYGLRVSLLRPPGEARIDVALALFESELAHYAGDEAAALAFATEPLGPLAEGESAAELAAWTVVASVLLNQDAVLVKD